MSAQSSDRNWTRVDPKDRDIIGEALESSPNYEGAPTEDGFEYVGNVMSVEMGDPDSRFPSAKTVRFEVGSEWDHYPGRDQLVEEITDFVDAMATSPHVSEDYAETVAKSVVDEVNTVYDREIQKETFPGLNFGNYSIEVEEVMPDSVPEGQEFGFF